MSFPGSGRSSSAGAPSSSSGSSLVLRRASAQSRAVRAASSAFSLDSPMRPLAEPSFFFTAPISRKAKNRRMSTRITVATTSPPLAPGSLSVWVNNNCQIGCS